MTDLRTQLLLAGVNVRGALVASRLRLELAWVQRSTWIRIRLVMLRGALCLVLDTVRVRDAELAHFIKEFQRIEDARAKARVSRDGDGDRKDRLN